MFANRHKDRRQSYSFKAHFHRALSTKGVRGLVAPILGTVVIAGSSFAYCSSDGITGPDGGSGRSPTAPISAHSSGGGVGTIEVTPFPVTTDEIPTELAEEEVPTTMQNTACNGDVVDWQDARTRGGGVTYLNPRTGSARTIIRIKQWASGKGTRWMSDPRFPKRWYNGYQEYEKEIFTALGEAEIEEEFELEIKAKDDKETRQFQDDYKLRLRVVISARNGRVTIRSSTYEKCY